MCFSAGSGRCSPSRPGYATASFPPAGIAVAAMLIGGPATLPWTFLGSLLLNLWVGRQSGETVGAAALAACVIAAGSSAQAAVAGEALRRAIGYPTPLDHGRELARFLLLSRICCLTSATLSLAGLAALGVVKPEDLTGSWVAWWIGDRLGVLPLLLVLVIAGEPRRPVEEPGLFRGPPDAVVLCPVRGDLRPRQPLEHDACAARIPHPVARAGRQAAHRARRTGMSSGSSCNARFPSWPPCRGRISSLVRDFRRRFPTVQAIEWALRVERPERARFEAVQRAERPASRSARSAPRARRASPATAPGTIP
jgi:hypothetical protein